MELLSSDEALVRNALPVMPIAQERAKFEELRSYRENSEDWLRIREEIARANFLLLMAAVRRSRARNVDPDDLRAEGLVTLLKSVDKFDHTRGFKFGTYAMRALNNTFGRIGIRENKHRHDDIEVMDWNPTHAAPDLDAQELHEILETNVADLTSLEVRLVKARFGFGGKPTRTYESLGKLGGFGKERARQVVGDAVAKLRGVMQPPGESRQSVSPYRA